MAADKQQINKSSIDKKRELPKNIRQIGEPGNKKIYIEDYVYIYLNRLAQPDSYYARGAILFGQCCQTPVGNCLFISGAAACQRFELDIKETQLDDEAWEEIYQIRDKYFKDLEVVGWFLSRMGFSTDLNDWIIRIHMDNFSGEHRVLYIVDSLEHEDAFYQLENYNLKKQKGYYVYYEVNEAMKSYMMGENSDNRHTEKERGSETIRRDAAVVRDYKKTLNKKKKITKPKKHLSASGVMGAVAMSAVLLYGIYSVGNFRNEEKITPVFDYGEETTTQKVFETMTTEKITQNSSESTTETATQAMQNSETTHFGSDESSESATTETSEETMSNTTEITSEEPNTKTAEEKTTSEVPVFTQEEPDDAQEAWNYIGGYYTVKRGDTLAGISKKIFQSYDYIDAIAKENQIENVDEIYPGQILEIPEMTD